MCVSVLDVCVRVYERERDGYMGVLVKGICVRGEGEM